MLLARWKNEIHCCILGSGEHFSIGGDLRVAYRRIDIQCEHLDYPKNNQNRRDILARRIFYREPLYSDFISESARAVADAIQHNLRDPGKLTPTYALLSRIRLSSSPNVLASAEQVIQHIIDIYSKPKRHARRDAVQGSNTQGPFTRIQ